MAYEIADSKHQSSVKHGLSILNFSPSLSLSKRSSKENNHPPLLSKTENVHSVITSNDLEKVLKKIITGLTSPNKIIRSEYYIILATLLHQSKDIPFEQIKKCIENVVNQCKCQSAPELIYKHNSSKSEDITNVLMGELLAYGALVRSGTFFTYSESNQDHIVEKILSFRSKEERFSLAASVFITDVIEKVDEDTFAKLVWPKLKQEIVVPWLDQNLDTLYLIFMAKRKFPDVINACSAIKILNNSELFSADNMKYLCTKLLDVSSYDQLNHPVYSAVSNEIANSVVLIYFVYQLDNCLEEKSLQKFVAVSVILTDIIRALEDLSLLSELLQYNFLQQLQQHFLLTPPNDHDYPKAVEKVNELFETLLNVFKNSHVVDRYKVALLKKLLLYPGDLFIENCINVKIVQGITSILHTEGVKELLILYKRIVTETIRKEDKAKVCIPWNLEEKKHASKTLVQLLTHPAVSEEFEWRAEQMTFLIYHGFVSDNSTENVNPDLAEYLRELFYTSLNVKLPNIEQQRYMLSSIFKYFKNLTYQLDLNINLRVKLPPETLQMWNDVNDFLNVTEEKTKINEPIDLFFNVLILQMTLYLLTGDEIAIACVEEVLLCYQKVKNMEEKVIKNNEIILDLFLTLLTYDSEFIKKSVHLMREHVNKFVTYATVRKLLPILDPLHGTSPLYTCFDPVENEEDPQECNEYIDVCDLENQIIKRAIKGKRFQKYRECAQKVFETLKVTNANVSNDRCVVVLKEYVVTILDSFVSNDCNLKACLEILASLINSLEISAKKNQQTLTKSLKNCFKTVTSLRKFESFGDLTSTELSNFLKALFDKANEENLPQNIMNYISKSCQFIIRCSTLLETAPEQTKRKLNQKLTKTLTTTIETFFNSKEPSNVFSIFKNIFKQKWICILYVIPNLYVYVFKRDLKIVKKIQALELLTIFYDNHGLLTAEKFRIEKFLQDDVTHFSENIIDFFKNLCLNSPQTKQNEKYITNMFHLLTAVMNSPIKNDHFDWKSIKNYVKQYRGLTIFTRDAKSAYNKLFRKLEPYFCVKEGNLSTQDGDGLPIMDFKNGNVSNEELITKLSSCSEKLNSIVLSLKGSNQEQKYKEINEKSHRSKSPSLNNVDPNELKPLRVELKPGSSNVRNSRSENGDYEYISIIRKVHKGNKRKNVLKENRSYSQTDSAEKSKEQVKSGKSRSISKEKIESDKEPEMSTSNEFKKYKTTSSEKYTTSDLNKSKNLTTNSTESKSKSEYLIQPNLAQKSKTKHEVFSKSCPTIDEETDVDLYKGNAQIKGEKLAPKSRNENNPTSISPKENLTRKKAQTNMDAIQKPKNKVVRNNNKIKNMISSSNNMFENLLEAINPNETHRKRLVQEKNVVVPKKLRKQPQDSQLTPSKGSTNIIQGKVPTDPQKKNK